MTEPILRLALLGTPRCGNNWLKVILSNLYALPFNLDEWEAYVKPRNPQPPPLPDGGWIIHQHVPPITRLQDFLQRSNIQAITLARHPGDILVSLHHFIRRQINGGLETTPHLRVLAHDSAAADLHVMQYVRKAFHRELFLTLAWAAVGVPVVRYEDLHADPYSLALQASRLVHEVPPETVVPAVADASLDHLQADDNHPWYYRSGRTEDWRSELSEAVVRRLLENPMVCRFCETFGYDFGTAYPPPEVKQPPLPAAALDIPLIQVLRKEWPEGEEASFLTWLVEPLPVMESQDKNVLFPISNLMAQVYALRPDLQAAFPQPLSADRVGFYWWCLFNLQHEYDIPAAAIPVLERFSPNLVQAQPES